MTACSRPPSPIVSSNASCASRSSPRSDPSRCITTTHEREVLELIAHGFSNSEIVARLDLTEATIKLTWPTAIATSASATMP
jgi:DNA-binding NarL/FixJ family response regulator